ncbi:MerR family transcriptional regulator [Acinetobacter sp. S40]|uniref:chaperone modulator CbpM n=1 Tax=unclassified Acinetobacter TaxID=196816 RepID=UPI001909B193|nr:MULTISPECIES: chaperone modulator CbpM [unclassified Acinetobacter]MBJ9984158.1 MerR family transcriptional regulator [Acinetobacter sp. S40]MBK0062792.1 MerR family transcriptional regulator [Acinetobacter sp. S55]MBK0065631.1 MerR family transcriptional regulator [Acinetobacter sp. S54]
MPTIHYREIVYSGLNEAEIIDEQCTFDLTHFAQISGQSPEWILQLIDYDILSASGQPQQYRFSSTDVIRARRAYRLQRDFDASLSAVAVMLDLIDEVHHLRRKIRPNQS